MWCLLLILLPIALVFSESSMSNLQSVSIVAAFPIGMVILLIVAGFLKDAGAYLKEIKKPSGQDRTATERNYVAEATRRRRRILQAGFFLVCTDSMMVVCSVLCNS